MSATPTYMGLRENLYGPEGTRRFGGCPRRQSPPSCDVELHDAPNKDGHAGYEDWPTQQSQRDQARLVQANCQRNSKRHDAGKREECNDGAPEHAMHLNAVFVID